MVEWLRCHKEYLPRPSKFEGFLDHICIYTRPGTMTDSKVSDMRFSRYPKGTIKRKSSRIPKATSSRLIKRSTTPMVGLSHLSQGGSKNKQLVRSRMSPTSLKYLKWSEVPITFNRSEGCQAQPSPHRWKQLPEHSVPKNIRPDGVI
jgi:hypothetical protein